MKTYEDRGLNQASETAKVLPYNDGSKIVLVSDCHRGQGNAVDNFLPNQNLFFGVLEHYNRNGFAYIELGDDDELWEGRRMKPIIELHSDAFWTMKQFYEGSRFHIVYGDHGIIKGRQKYQAKRCTSYYYECEKKKVTLFSDLGVLRNIIPEHEEKKHQILLLHGRQREILNGMLWPLARFLVRYVQRSLGLVGVLDPTRVNRSHRVKDRVENRLDTYTREHSQLLITGHIHRPFFSESGNSHYFNDRSYVHPRCITRIETEDDKISLVKWAVAARGNHSLYVVGTALEEPGEIDRYFQVNVIRGDMTAFPLF